MFALYFGSLFATHERQNHEASIVQGYLDQEALYAKAAYNVLGWDCTGTSRLLCLALRELEKLCSWFAEKGTAVSRESFVSASSPESESEEQTCTFSSPLNIHGMILPPFFKELPTFQQVKHP